MAEKEKPARKNTRQKDKRGHDKVKLLLSMNEKTARRKLARSICYQYYLTISMGLCHWCHKFVEEKDFSLEHIIPWRKSDNPKEKYFDLKNITVSHRSCNSKAYSKQSKT